jgi:hypothetical protein
MMHIINGAAGNIESHSTLDPGQSILNITAVLDQTHYGFGKLTIHNCSTLTWQYVKGDDGSIGDEVTLLKKFNGTCGSGNGTASPTGTGSSPSGTGSSVPKTPIPFTAGAERAVTASLAGLVGVIGLAAYLI